MCLIILIRKHKKKITSGFANNVYIDTKVYISSQNLGNLIHKKFKILPYSSKEILQNYPTLYKDFLKFSYLLYKHMPEYLRKI